MPDQQPDSFIPEPTDQSQYAVLFRGLLVMIGAMYVALEPEEAQSFRAAVSEITVSSDFWESITRGYNSVVEGRNSIVMRDNEHPERWCEKYGGLYNGPHCSSCDCERRARCAR